MYHPSFSFNLTYTMKRFYIKKLRDVNSPSQAYDEASHWDFYIPNDWALLPGVKHPHEHSAIFPTWEHIVIRPGTCLFVPSGLQIKMQPGWALRFDNKSGKGRKGLLVGAQIVDRDYQGELHLNVWNASKEDICVKRGESILQGAFYETTRIQLHEIKSYEELFTETSARGAKGFGSSQQINQ